MIEVLRKAGERGLTETDWLRSHHSFSFGDFRAKDFHQYRVLRVINEDFVKAGSGFPPHPHRDMEIITYVVAGSLEHKDSFGNNSIIQVGEWQRMSAGSGIEHSEWNPSETEDVHLFQIWIYPERKGLPPSYQQIRPNFKFNDFTLVASPDGREGSLKIQQDVDLYVMKLGMNGQKNFPLSPDRGVWFQIVSGEVQLDGTPYKVGDGIGMTDVEGVLVSSTTEAEVLIFDLI